jgi:hypothetical protein
VGAVAFGLKVEEETLGEMFFVFDQDDKWGGGISHGITGDSVRYGL